MKLPADRARPGRACRTSSRRSVRRQKTNRKALNETCRSSVAKGARGARIGVLRAEAPVASFQIHKDPRYLENARELARRALAGTRVIGGKAVREGEFLDCVSMGSDTQRGCSGTLNGPNVVLTAGHCADFATRVFFGNDMKKAGKVTR